MMMKKCIIIYLISGEVSDDAIVSGLIFSGHIHVGYKHYLLSYYACQYKTQEQ